jgi:hypothetical protein
MIVEVEGVDEKVFDARWPIGKEDLLGKEPKTVGSELLHACSVDDDGRNCVDARLQQRIGAMIAVAQKPASTITGYFEERASRVKGEGRGCIDRRAEMDVGIIGLEHECVGETVVGHIASYRLRRTKGQREEGRPIMRRWDGDGIRLRRKDEAALEGNEAAKVDDAERPCEAGHLVEEIRTKGMGLQGIAQDCGFFVEYRLCVVPRRALRYETGCFR